MSEVSLGRATVLLLLCRAAGYVLALANAIILARALGVDALGAYAYAMGIAGLFGLVPNLGINHVITRTIAREGPERGGVLRAGLQAQALLAAGILIVIPLFAAALPGHPVPLGYVALAGAQMALGTLSWPYLAVLAGGARYDRVATIELASAVVGSATLLASVALRGGVRGVLAAHLVAAGISLAITRERVRPFLPARGGPDVSLGTLMRQAAPFGTASAVQSIYTRLDILFLGQMASTHALGLYNVAYKPTNMLVYLGSTVAGPVFPLMAQAGPREAPVAFQRAMRGLAAGGPAMALALTGLSGPLVRMLFGAAYGAAAPILAVLAWSAAANWLYAPLGMALQARGQERRWAASLGLALVLNAAGNLWAIPRWGPLGAAAATLTSEVALLVMGAVLLGRRLGMRPPLHSVLRGLACAAAGGAVLWVAGAAGALAGTGAALVVYAASLLLFRVVTAEDAMMVMGWIRQAAPGGSRA